MSDPLNKPYKSSKTIEAMSIINNVLYLCGLRYFWVEPETFSQNFLKRFNVISMVLHFTNCGFTVLLLSAFVTQSNLTTKQQADIVVNCAIPLTQFYCFVFMYYSSEARETLYKLMIVLKEEHNDRVVEKEMLRKLKLYIISYLCTAIWFITFYTAYGVSQKILTGTPFIAVITGWPDLKDVSTKAEIARIIFFGYSCIAFVRVSGSYVITLSMLIGLSKQYKNLQCYFYGLNEIFSEKLTQEEKEEKYEKAFIKGVQMHIETTWCLNRIKHVCRLVFDAQMLLTIICFVTILPVLMNSDRDPSSALTNLPTLLLGLLVTGFFMWNAGDISVEASILPEAIFGSGWQNCYYRTKRIRGLVVVAMNQAQQPVALTALGTIELSYNSYLNMIKTSHSLFSVFY